MFNSVSTVQNSCQVTALSDTRPQSNLLHSGSAEAVHIINPWCKNLTFARGVMLNQAMAIVLPAAESPEDEQNGGYSENHKNHLSLLCGWGLERSILCKSGMNIKQL